MFEAQYKLTLNEEVEIRYRTETDTWTDEDGTTHTDTYEVPYEYYILHVRLRNKTLPMVVGLLDAEQKEIYDITLELKGNKPYLWMTFTQAAEAAMTPEATIPFRRGPSDPAFAALISEAENIWLALCLGRLLQVPASTVPVLSAGFTRQAAFIICHAPRPREFSTSAPMYHLPTQSPGLDFFTKTYAYDGPVSHVGIYVGGGMMIPAATPSNTPVSIQVTGRNTFTPLGA